VSESHITFLIKKCAQPFDGERLISKVREFAGLKIVENQQEAGEIEYYLTPEGTETSD